MKLKDINKSISDKMVYLETDENIEYYGNVIALLFMIGMILLIDLKEDLSAKRFPVALILFITIAILLIYNKITSRKFEIWKIKLTKLQFTEAFLATSVKLNCEPGLNKGNYLSASKSIAWQWDGIRITAIRTENEVYFNSMIGPSIRSTPFSFGWHQKIKDEFRKNIFKVLAGEDVVAETNLFQSQKEQLFWNESEWTVANLFKRILGYILAIVFIILGVMMIIDGQVRGIILGFAILSLCITYLYYDIRIILIKSEKKSWPGKFSDHEY